MFVPVLEEAGSLSTELETLVATADPEIIKTLFTKKAHTEKRSRFYKVNRMLDVCVWILCTTFLLLLLEILNMQFSRYALYGMDGVLNLEGEEWKRHTRAVRDIFHGGHVDQHEETIRNIVKEHINSWEYGETAEFGVLPSRRSQYAPSFYRSDPFPGGRPVPQTKPKEVSNGGPDLLSAVRGIAMDVILMYGFNVNPASELGVSLASELSLYPHVVGLFSNVGALMAWNFQKIIACTNRIRNLVKDVRKQNEEESQTVESKRISDGISYGSIPNFVTNMIKAGFELKELAAEVNHIHGAHKAVAFVGTCLLWRLSKHPEWVEKARQEWNEKLRNGEAPNRNILSELVVTKAIIWECLRMHTVSLGVVRQTGEPIEMQGKTIPTGTEVIVLLHALHHHPKFWNDPLTFNPSRFLEGKPAPYTFIPFLDGARMCAGKQLAELQLCTVMHTILKDYDIQTGIDELTLKPDMYSALDVTIPFTIHARK